MHSAPSPFSIRAPAPRPVRPSPTRYPLDSRPSAVPPPSVGVETVCFKSLLISSNLQCGLQSISRCTPPRDAPSCLMSPIRLPERRARPPCPVSDCHDRMSCYFLTDLFPFPELPYPPVHLRSKAKERVRDALIWPLAPLQAFGLQYRL